MLKLLNFPGKSGNLNIPERIGTKYFMFGVLLLNDETGAQVNKIATQYRGDAKQINLEILRLWIGGKGKPLSWDTLINVLKAIGLNLLASDIQDEPHHWDHSICKSECVCCFSNFLHFTDIQGIIPTLEPHAVTVLLITSDYRAISG